MKLLCGNRFLVVNRGDFRSFPTIEQARAAANGAQRWYTDSSEMRDTARYIVDLGVVGADGRYHYDSATMVATEVLQ